MEAKQYHEKPNDSMVWDSGRKLRHGTYPSWLDIHQEHNHGHARTPKIYPANKKSIEISLVLSSKGSIFSVYSFFEDFSLPKSCFSPLI